MPHADLVTRRAYHAAWKRRNPAKVRRWTKLDDACRHANKRAVRYGITEKITCGDVATVLHRNAVCHWCGSPQRLGLDHVIALFNGGPNRLDNLVAACHSCNASRWRSSEPPRTRWARDHDACIDCGTIEKHHCAHGRCVSCHSRYQSRRRRAR